MYPDLFRALTLSKDPHPHESIRESVEVLLNARKGALPYASFFGVPDFLDSMVSDYAEKLKAMVLHQIKKNEPRIKSVFCDSFNEKKSLSSMRYELQVTLKNEEQVDLRIETTGAGQFYVYI